MIRWIRYLLSDRRAMENPVLEDIDPTSSTVLDKVLMEKPPVEEVVIKPINPNSTRVALELSREDGVLTPAGRNPYDSTIAFDD